MSSSQRGNPSIFAKTDGIACETISEAETSVMIGCSPRHLFKLRKAGLIPFVMVGSLVRYDPEAVRQWIKAGGARLPTTKKTG